MDEHAAPTSNPLPGPQNWRGVEQGLKDATAHMQGHLYTQAEESLLQLLEFAPMEGKAWHMLGRCHQSGQRHAKALECFERAGHCYARVTAHDAPPASAHLARLLMAQGDAQAAHAMLSGLLQQQPDNAKLLAMQKDWLNSGAMSPQTAKEDASA